MKVKRFLAVVLIVLLLAACTEATVSPLPTPTPETIEMVNFSAGSQNFSRLIAKSAVIKQDIEADTLYEYSDAAGVTIDGLTLKDGGIAESFTVAGGLEVTGNLTVSTLVSQSVGFNATGSSAFLTMTVSGPLSVTGAVNMDSTLDVDGNISSGTGAVTITDDVNITGTTTHGGSVYLEGYQLDLDADNDTSITADTDDQIDFEVAGQDVFSITQPASYFNMDVYLRYSTLEKTANYTLTTQESGALVDNKGATAEITITLPSATSGLGYCFGVYAAYTVTILPDASDLIYHLTNSAGDRLQNAGAAGDSVCLYALDGIDWFPMQEIGTWSDAD